MKGAGSGRAPALRRRLVNLGFLGPEPFCGKDPAFEGWISLDFLGFSRPNRDLSMGYTGFSLKSFSWPFCPWAFEAAGRTAADEAMRKRRGVHRASLTWILIFCSLLSSRPVYRTASIQSCDCAGAAEDEAVRDLNARKWRTFREGFAEMSGGQSGYLSRPDRIDAC